MFYMGRWSDKQRKENRIAHQKKEAAHDAEAIKYRDKFKKSYSATHPPYVGTAICPDQKMRGRNK